MTPGLDLKWDLARSKMTR